jgi:HK97 family phage prohead protease
VKTKTPKQFVDQAAFRAAFRAGKVPAVRTGAGLVTVTKGADGKFAFIMSNADTDRMGDNIQVAGWQVANFVKNPVMLWAHDYSTPPVGRVGKVGVEGDNLVARDVEFQAREVFEFGWSIGEMYAAKMLNAVSVGFDPIELAWKDDDSGGILFMKQDLLELSAVPVPAHPGALQLAKSAGLLVPEWKKWAESVLDTQAPHEESAIVRSAREFYAVIAPPAVQVKEAASDEPVPEIVDLAKAIRENTASHLADAAAKMQHCAAMAAHTEALNSHAEAMKSLAKSAAVDGVVARTLSLLKK